MQVNEAGQTEFESRDELAVLDSIYNLGLRHGRTEGFIMGLIVAALAFLVSLSLS